MSRDPIEEKGGLNLYAFSHNNSISFFDLLGLDGITAIDLRDEYLDDDAGEQFETLCVVISDVGKTAADITPVSDLYEIGSGKTASGEQGNRLAAVGGFLGFKLIDKLKDFGKCCKRVILCVRKKPDVSISPSIVNKLPPGWGSGVPNQKPGTGFRWHDPGDPGNGFRYDIGNPESPFPAQQVDHVVVRCNGKVIGRDGKPIKGSIKQNYEQAHIPASEYEKWKFWNKPE